MVKVSELLFVTRPWSFIMTVISIALGLTYAFWVQGFVEPIYLVLTLLALLGSILLHAAVNVWNDYYDYMYGVDSPRAGTAIYRPHPLVHGLMSPKHVQLLAVASAVTGIAIGIAIAVAGRWLALLLGGIGLLLAYGYTGPPFKLKYRGLGEITVLITWGPLITGGAYYVARGILDINVMLASLPLGILVAAVLLANNIRDIDADRRANVKTLAVVLGRELSLKLYGSMIALAYVIQTLLVATGILPVLSLLSLATLPTAIRLIARFREAVPPDADPQTAKLVQQFGIAYIVGIAASALLHV